MTPDCIVKSSRMVQSPSRRISSPALFSVRLKGVYRLCRIHTIQGGLSSGESRAQRDRALCGRVVLLFYSPSLDRTRNPLWRHDEDSIHIHGRAALVAAQLTCNEVSGAASEVRRYSSTSAHNRPPRLYDSGGLGLASEMQARTEEKMCRSSSTPGRHSKSLFSVADALLACYVVCAAAHVEICPNACHSGVRLSKLCARSTGSGRRKVMFF